MGTCVYSIYLETLLKEITCLALPTLFILLMYIGKQLLANL